MRINVYTEELLTDEDHPQSFAEIVTAEYISSRTGERMMNYGVRIFVRSAPELHYIPGRDDDRSAVTFWCGTKQNNVFSFLDTVREYCHITDRQWREQNSEAVEMERLRNTPDMESHPVVPK